LGKMYLELKQCKNVRELNIKLVGKRFYKVFKIE